MAEIKVVDASEKVDILIKGDGFKDIKPEMDISVKDAKDFISALFNFEKGIIESDNSDKLENLKQGGAYKDLPNIENKQKHHMPADSTTGLSYGDGPCLLMDTEDHKKTASYGNSKDAQESRALQKEEINQGNFDKALQMDIDDIHEKFGGKYDEGIIEIKDYCNSIKEEGKIA